jgi:AhpD family alkylhydroperoxidase
MKQRIDYKKASPEAFKAMLAVEACVRSSGLDHGLLELVKIRVSQINGCAFCLDMHTRDARKAGESEQRLHLLAAWRDAPCYSDFERAALAWAEVVTKLSCTAVSDELYAQARLHFGEKALVDLTLAIVAINGWNRLAVAFRTVPGS